MRKRSMVALATGALLASMLPGAASATGPGSWWIDASCETPPDFAMATTPDEIGDTVQFFVGRGCTITGIEPVFP